MPESGLLVCFSIAPSEVTVPPNTFPGILDRVPVITDISPDKILLAWLFRVPTILDIEPEKDLVVLLFTSPDGVFSPDKVLLVILEITPERLSVPPKEIKANLDAVRVPTIEDNAPDKTLLVCLVRVPTIEDKSPARLLLLLLDISPVGVTFPAKVFCP